MHTGIRLIFPVPQSSSSSLHQVTFQAGNQKQQEKKGKEVTISANLFTKIDQHHDSARSGSQSVTVAVGR